MNCLSIFDLDNTLITCDSDVAWASYLTEKGIWKEKEARLRDKFYNDYDNGCLDIDAFLRFQLSALSQFSCDELNSMHKEYMDKYIKPHITKTAIKLVANHLEKNDEVLLISATNESLFEKLKTLILPTMLYFLIWGLITKISISFALTITLIFEVLLVVLTYYSYIEKLHSNNEIIDIIIFICSTLISLIVATFLINLNLPNALNIVCKVINIILLLCIFIFTYFPPKHFIFIDEVSKIKLKKNE